MNKSRWDERYGTEDYVFGTEPNGFLVEALAGLTATKGGVPGRALCIADGEGRNSVYLAGLGYQVTAMDASAMGMEKARRLAAARGVWVATEVADLVDFDFGSESWDLVVSIFCHLPPELRRDVHRRVVEALRPGGAFVLESYTPDQLAYGTGGPPTAELMMREADARSELVGLDLIVAREIVRDVVEGRGHTGTAAVLQLVGLKPPLE